mmetsp:Transcript_39028/g.83039  ORF Transcript_39028/g.83039 Transcript_39028/m.83039 type:complete len:252 (-) Transcript_39028:1792-2547(-)
MLACLAPFFISTSEASHISANLSSASCVSAQFAARATSSLLLLLRLILLLLARDQTSQIDRARAGDITLHGAQPSLPRPFCALWQHRRHLLLLLLLLLLSLLLRVLPPPFAFGLVEHGLLCFALLACPSSLLHLLRLQLLLGPRPRPRPQLSCCRLLFSRPCPCPLRLLSCRRLPPVAASYLWHDFLLELGAVVLDGLGCFLLLLLLLQALALPGQALLRLALALLHALPLSALALRGLRSGLEVSPLPAA